MKAKLSNKKIHDFLKSLGIPECPWSLSEDNPDRLEEWFKLMSKIAEIEKERQLDLLEEISSEMLKCY